MKMSDTFVELSKSLQNIIDEAKKIKLITITYNIASFLGNFYQLHVAYCRACHAFDVSAQSYKD